MAIKALSVDRLRDSKGECAERPRAPGRDDSAEAVISELLGCLKGQSPCGCSISFGNCTRRHPVGNECGYGTEAFLAKEK